MSHSSSYLVLCVVCQKTSSETPFNCRYRVHERNENALAQFFEKNLKNGQLCDRCYRKWYKHKREHQINLGEGIKIPVESGKRKRETLTDENTDSSPNEDIQNQKLEDVIISLRKMPRRVQLENNLNSVGSDDTDSAFFPDYTNINSKNKSQNIGNPKKRIQRKLFGKNSENNSPIENEETILDNSPILNGNAAYSYRQNVSNSWDIPYPDDESLDDSQDYSHEITKKNKKAEASLKDIINNFDESLEKAKARSRIINKRRKHSSNSSKIFEYFQKKSIQTRKSKRKNFPFRSYQPTTFKSENAFEIILNYHEENSNSYTI